MATATCPPITLNNVPLPQVDEVKYLGIHFDRRLIWRSHIWKKRLQLNLKTQKLNWLIGNHSKLSVENKLLVYKVILKPIWTYGIQLWGTASNTNIDIIQRYQSKTLRRILQAPWYVNNQIIHNDTNTPSVRDTITKLSNIYQLKLEDHPNHLAVNLLDNSQCVFRLKRHSILDLGNRFQ
uniref:RNA-directed DNA polymerase n=2 Tax=Cuerna arida TaxID=1464854 RepID=A0A1B6F9K4_9HEMI